MADVLLGITFNAIRVATDEHLSRDADAPSDRPGRVLRCSGIDAIFYGKDEPRAPSREGLTGTPLAVSARFGDIMQFVYSRVDTTPLPDKVLHLPRPPAHGGIPWQRTNPSQS